MPKTNICDKVVTIPQYKNTGWLNAILMCILYSQNSRKLLLHENELPANANQLVTIINDILSKQYIQNDKTAEYFNNDKIKKILTIIGFNAYPELYEIAVSTGWSSYLYLPSFIASINKTSISLECLGNNIFVGMNNNITHEINGGKLITIFNRHNLNDAYFLELNEIINNTANPDYIFVHPLRQRTIYNNLIHPFMEDPDYRDKFNLNTYTRHYRGILEKDVKIMYKGDEYIQDSCISLNYNAGTINQSYPIAGITCENERYVYTGLLSTTTNKGPCKLFKFNWTHDDADFSIDTSNCELKLSQNKNNSDACFSFKTGELVLIYVKKNSVQALLSTDKSASSSQNKRDKLYNLKKKLYIATEKKIKQKLDKLDEKLDKLEEKKGKLIEKKGKLIEKQGKLIEKKNKLTDKIQEIEKKLKK